jgi:hypothetical protein
VEKRAHLPVGAWRTDASGPNAGNLVHPAAPGREQRRVPSSKGWIGSYRPHPRALRSAERAAARCGNGRIARALTDLCLARSEQSGQRFYSMSSQIRAERKTYYETLEATQKGTLDVTPWVRWFLDCLGRAFDRAETILGSVLQKARFWEVQGAAPLNERQRKILNRLLDGFEGNLTSSKWAKLAKCSQDTALRDIDDLLARGILAKNPAGGRSTSYSLVLG